MTADPNVKVGRAATPPPPNVGSSSLGNVLQLMSDPRFVHRRHVLCLGSPQTRKLMADSGFDVFPVVPGLANEALSSLNTLALVIEEESLSQGLWAGTLTDVAPELRAELEQLVVHAQKSNIRTYWIRREAVADAEDVDGEPVDEPETAGLPDLPCPAGILIAPGSAMFKGTEEGARASKLTDCLTAAVRQK